MTVGPFCAGLKAKTEVLDNKDGTHTVTYVPLTSGMYTLLLKYGGKPVPGFPAKVMVDPAVDTSKVKVFGPGVEGQGPVSSLDASPLEARPFTHVSLPLWSRAAVFREATTDFTVDARPLSPRGGDHVKAEVRNPSGALTDCSVTDNGDGTYGVQYTPFENGTTEFGSGLISNSRAVAERLWRFLGPHSVQVLYDDTPVPKSPFRVSVTEGCDPTRVVAEGPGLQSALTEKTNNFNIVTRYRPGLIPGGSALFHLWSRWVESSCAGPFSEGPVSAASASRWKVRPSPRCPARTTKTAAAAWSTSPSAPASTTSTSPTEDSTSPVSSAVQPRGGCWFNLQLCGWSWSSSVFGSTRKPLQSPGDGRGGPQ